MGKFKVEYGGGESRYNPSQGVDYMIVEVDGIELYAETLASETDETMTYDELKSIIIEQAKEKEISPDALNFMYDDRKVEEK